MKHRVTHTSHGQKILFDRILSSDLAVCKYNIKAFYKWESSTQIFSLRFLDERNIEVGINLNIDNGLFRSGSYSTELDICYRSYFIANYLRCLEGAEDTIPSSLFQGLVTLESICDIHTEGKIDIYSPHLATRSPGFKPINVHCAIRALTRLLIEQKNVINPDAQVQCESTINWMLEYTQLPEMMYAKSKKPIYALLNDLLALKKLLDKRPGITNNYSMFTLYGISNIVEQSVDELLGQSASNRFWNDAIMRIAAYSDGMRGLIDLATLPGIRESVVEFKEKSLSCYQESHNSKNIVLADNLLAIKKLSKRVEQTFSLKEPANSGTLHFIQ